MRDLKRDQIERRFSVLTNVSKTIVIAMRYANHDRFENFKLLLGYVHG